MSMNMEIAVFFLGQSVIIIGAIVMAYVRLHVAIARLQRDVVHLGEVAVERKKNHTNLTDKVDGISRTVSRLEGIHKAS